MDKSLNEISKQAIAGKRVKTFLIMSAESHIGETLSDDAVLEIPKNNPNHVCTAVNDEERTNIYATMLRKHQFCHFPVKGKFGSIEYSFIVYNIALDDAKRLGRYFDQRDIIFGEVSERSTGVFNLYRKDESEFANVKDKARNYYLKETIEEYLPITSDAYMSETLQNIVSGMAFVNDLVEERCQKHWSYATRYHRNLTESISDNFTPWGRRQRRAGLWGKYYEIECNAYERENVCNLN